MKQDKLFKYSLLISFFMVFLFGLLTGMLLLRHSIKKQHQDANHNSGMMQLSESDEFIQENVAIDISKHSVLQDDVNKEEGFGEENHYEKAEYYGNDELWKNRSVQEKDSEQDSILKSENEELAFGKILTTGTESAIQGKYFVLVTDGNLEIYVTEPLEKYFTTSFETGHLSDTMQLQLEQGIELQNDQELYDFLENISS